MGGDHGGLGVWLGAEPANDSPVFLSHPAAGQVHRLEDSSHPGRRQVSRVPALLVTPASLKHPQKCQASGR